MKEQQGYKLIITLLEQNSLFNIMKKQNLVLTILLSTLLLFSCADRELEIEYNPNNIVDSNNTNIEDEDEEEEENEVINNTGESVVVGSSIICGTSLNANVPAKYNGFGTNSWSAVIYTASDLQNKAGSIQTISYIIDCKSSDCEADPVSNQKIYIKEVNDGSFSNNNLPDINTMTLVYQGNITWILR